MATKKKKPLPPTVKVGTVKREQERTTQTKADMIRALETNLGIVSNACKTVGIERKTHYRWLEDDAEYAASVAAIQEHALDYVEHQLFKLVQNMETAAIIFYLKTKGKGRGYIERYQTQEVKPGPFVIETDRSDATNVA